MDNLCHTLAGVALGEAGLKQRTALGMGTLLIASNLPDIDVAVFATNTLAMSFRRGWTHGVLALVVLPLALTGASLDARGRPASPRAGHRPTCAGCCCSPYLGTWLHVFMDFMNSYGVRLLMPFSDRWFYGDALYIVDPWLYLSARRRPWSVPAWRRIAAGRRRGARPARPRDRRRLHRRSCSPRTCGRAARCGAASTRAGPPPTRGSWSRRCSPIRSAAKSWSTSASATRRACGSSRCRTSGLPASAWTSTTADPAVALAARTPVVQAYLRWSRFPFFVVERTAAGTRSTSTTIATRARAAATAGQACRSIVP